VFFAIYYQTELNESYLAGGGRRVFRGLDSVCGVWMVGGSHSEGWRVVFNGG